MNRAALALVAILLLAGCGGGEASEPDTAETTQAEETTGAEPPQCESVWVADVTLPEGYENCMNGNSAPVGHAVDCADGDRALASYEDHWAFTGDTVQEFDPAYDDDPDGDPPFKAAYDECLDR